MPGLVTALTDPEEPGIRYRGEHQTTRPLTPVTACVPDFNRLLSVCPDQDWPRQNASRIFRQGHRVNARPQSHVAVVFIKLMFE